MLTQETITIDVNNVISFVVNRIESEPNITSHSFWIGYTTSLWRDTLDLKFVRQAIGYSKIDTTLRYIENLNNKNINHGYMP